MKFFEVVPSELFSPLASPNRILYADALDVLYAAYQENLKIREDVLYSMLRGRLEQELADATFEDEDIDEEELRDISGRARFLIRKLCSKGWFEKERGDDFEEYITIPNYSSRLLELFHQLRDDSPARGYSYVFGTFSALKVADDSDNAYEKMTALYSAYDNTTALISLLQMVYHNVKHKFENSKHLSEPNTSRRRVMLRIDKRELPEYQYEDAVVRDAYNIAARELEQQALVRLEWARKQSVLSCIVLDLERVAQCYECADRVHPRKKAEEVANIIMQKLADNPVPWIAAWRDAVCAQVRNSMKVPTYCRENDGLLQELLLTFQRYAELSGSVTMRAFSSQCFHDTKYFERNVRELFLTIARKYNTQLAAACTEAELGERDQLAFLGIYARPELYELSGDCAICLKKGELQLSAAEPYGLALPSTLVSEIVDIELKNICCITFIENKTNYDEYLLAEKQPEELAVYHGGFLSPQKKKLFEKLAAAAGETMQIRFWADIDLGGFCMFENLQTVFPQLEPMRMEGRFVEQYHKNGLKRPEQYLKKLKKERNVGRYTLFVDAIDKILQYGVTIEQETFLE